MRSQEIRSSFLRYFADHGHKIVPSSPLIPHDDPTLLFINAGMNQFKKVFLGLEKRDYSTAASSQKCIRAGGKHNDLENVGFTARHHTFFEMLGNFSFGDYFKEKAIAYAWEYVTRILGLKPSNLYATVFTEDDEAERLWKKIAPELGDRILRFSEKDNYWSMGETGPCGPCSEIHYDRGDKYPGELNGEGDRYVEIWNLVFMQFDRDESGNLTPLPRPSVDTGAGLERFAMILQNAESNYETDLFTPLIDRVSELSGVKYSSDQRGISHKVIADHIRALSFAIADGGIISNEGRGYVLRRILRRAARHGRLLNMHEPFLYKIVGPLTKIMGNHYPELNAKREHIELVVKSEEEQFGQTLDTGLEIFEDIVKKIESTDSTVIPGSDVFRLYDTYGFPVDLTDVMARERGLHADMEGFEKELEIQKQRSRKESNFKTILSDAFIIKKRDEQVEPFIGYEFEKIETGFLGSMSTDDNYNIILNQTPFYAESGGQIGDTGYIYSDDFRIRVEDTQKRGEEILHIGKIEFGDISEGYSGKAIAEVDHEHRADIKRNHTATHLLHKALRLVLGDHVHQSGSLVDDERLRFDFTHSRAMTPQEVDKVENLVKGKIKEDLPVKWEVMPFEKAKEKRAMALFGEKYADEVRVVETGDFSIELCGGTHVDNTADIGEFFITQETAIAAGMRRIEALTGRGAVTYLAEQEKVLSALSGFLNRDIESIAAEDVSQFKTLQSQAHARLLKKRNLFKKVNDYSSRIEKHLRKKQKETVSEISVDAYKLEPVARIGKELILIYKPAIDNTNHLLAYLDTFKKKHPQSAIVAVSGNTGTFAISSPEYKLSNDIFAEIVTISGARGGGKPTIRGSLRVDTIDSVIKGLKKKFG
jgi:alanyl-tRNA synthetase